MGEDRTVNGAYVWKDMLDNGVNLMFGSDWPTSPFSPLAHLQDAQLRESQFADGEVRQWDGGECSKRAGAAPS